MSFILRIFDYFYFALFGGVKSARRKGVIVGENCRVYIYSWGSEPFLIRLGDNVTVTSGVKFITHDGSTCLIKNRHGERYQKYGRIFLGDNVFIGVNSIILPGVTIGSNVIIAAGSVVTRDLADSGVYAGVPVKRLAEFKEYESGVVSSCSNDGDLKGITDYKKRVFKALSIQNEKK